MSEYKPTAIVPGASEATMGYFEERGTAPLSAAPSPPGVPIAVTENKDAKSTEGGPFHLALFPSDFVYPAEMPNPHATNATLCLHAAYRNNCPCATLCCSDSVIHQSRPGTCSRHRHDYPGKTGIWVGWSTTSKEQARKNCPSCAAIVLQHLVHLKTPDAKHRGSKP